jgi:flotillin
MRIAEGQLAATLKNAEGIQAEGTAKAEAEKALLLAPVNAQLTLAKEIGENQSYQDYLIKIRNVEATEAVGKEMASAIKAADLKIIANGGDVQSGMSNLASVFSPAGGTSIAGMLSALGQTDEGKALVDGVIKKLGTPAEKNAKKNVNS